MYFNLLDQVFFIGNGGFEYKCRPGVTNVKLPTKLATSTIYWIKLNNTKTSPFYGCKSAQYQKNKKSSSK